MQQFDITVPVVGSFVVHAAGRYIKYMSGSNGGGDASLYLTPGAQGGTKIRLQPGFAYRVAEDIGMPDSWTLQNAAGSAPIIGQVVIGNGKIDDSTVQGVVQMVDGGKVRTLAGIAFIGGTTQVAAAGANSRLQLWNPAANTMRAVVEQITFNSSAATGCAIYGAAAALANPFGGGIAKKLGAAASSLLLQADTTAAPFAGPYMGNMVVDAQFKQVVFRPNEPWVIPPGFGLVLQTTLQNVNCSATFEWYEEANV